MTSQMAGNAGPICFWEDKNGNLKNVALPCVPETKRQVRALLTEFGKRPDSRALKTQILNKTMALTNAPDLTKQPPRSPRVRLGGYVILPRMLDKGRATIAGKNGEYNYACPMDQRLLEFTGIEPEALKQQIAAGKGDWEILEWINASS